MELPASGNGDDYRTVEHSDRWLGQLAARRGCHSRDERADQCSTDSKGDHSSDSMEARGNRQGIGLNRYHNIGPTPRLGDQLGAMPCRLPGAIS
jgi:hypothetical protein